MANNPNRGNGGNAGKEESPKQEAAPQAEPAKSGESKPAEKSSSAGSFNLRMKVDISGRRNLELWPQRGEVLKDVPANEAAELVFNGYAEPEEEGTEVPQPEFKSIYGDNDAPNVGLGGTVVRTGALPGPS